jgi:hypothetical protein
MKTVNSVERKYDTKYDMKNDTWNMKIWNMYMKYEHDIPVHVDIIWNMYMKYENVYENEIIWNMNDQWTKKLNMYRPRCTSMTGGGLA